MFNLLIYFIIFLKIMNIQIWQAYQLKATLHVYVIMDIQWDEAVIFLPFWGNIRWTYATLPLRSMEWDTQIIVDWESQFYFPEEKRLNWIPLTRYDQKKYEEQKNLPQGEE